MLFRPYALKPQELEGRALELWGEFPLWFQQEFLIAAEPKHDIDWELFPSGHPRN
jgi:hypothetical protein